MTNTAEISRKQPILHSKQGSETFRNMKILMCSYFKFPNGCAGAVRHEKFAQMLMEMGHDVFVVGLGEANGFKRADHKSIPFTSLRYGVSMPDKIKSRLLYWHNLKKILKEYQPQAILMDDMHPLSGCIYACQTKT